MVEAAKNAIIKIEKDGELKENLKSKKWENVFADIGIDNPEEELTKANLVWEIE